MLFLRGIVPWVQVVLSLLLIVIVLLQQNEASLGSAFGGSGQASNFHTKRGLEKALFVSNIVIAILFILAAVSQLLLAA